MTTTSHTPEERIRSCLSFLYGQHIGDETWSQLQLILNEFHHRHPAHLVSSAGLNEKDAVLITYADTFQQPGIPPLRTLSRFLDEYLPDTFNGVHILPFYPYSSDDGFSVVDYRKVDPRLGDWEDISSLAARYRLMFDAVINHTSRESSWFKAYIRDEDPYRDYFITAGQEWDLSRVIRPRTLPLLTPVETSSGMREVWTTFSEDQMDLNYKNPSVLLEIISLILFYIRKGAGFLRLDAIAYLWKEPGTPCIHLPQTHAVIKILRAVLDLVAPQVLLITETNVPHRENIRYFGEILAESRRTDEAQLVYQFPLAPLILHTFASADSSHLSDWAASLDGQGPFFNFIASHDGIGLLPARGLLSETEISALVDLTLAHGGRVSYKSNSDGTKSPYEINITLFDALNDPARPEFETDIRRFLASQVIMLSLAGVPGVYVHSLFGSRNCLPCLEETGRARSINREKLDFDNLKDQLAHPGERRARRSTRILFAYRDLLQKRGERKAFHPYANQKVLFLDRALFTLVRTSQDAEDQVICVTNVSPSMQLFRLCPDAHHLPAASIWKDLIGNRSYPSHPSNLEIPLQAYQSLWLIPGDPL